MARPTDRQTNLWMIYGNRHGPTRRFLTGKISWDGGGHIIMVLYISNHQLMGINIPNIERPEVRHLTGENTIS